MINPIWMPFIQRSRIYLKVRIGGELVVEAGEIYEVTNHDTKVYVELAGISLNDAQKVIKLTSTRSCLPEPLRVAHLIASGISPDFEEIEKV